MHITDREKALAQITPDHPYWHGAHIIMGPLPRVETLWRNQELAGIWIFAFSTTRSCAATLIEHWSFVEGPKLHRVSPVFEWIGPR